MLETINNSNLEIRFYVSVEDFSSHVCEACGHQNSQEVEVIRSGVETCTICDILHWAGYTKVSDFEYAHVTDFVYIVEEYIQKMISMYQLGSYEESNLDQDDVDQAQKELEEEVEKLIKQAGGIANDTI